MPAGTTAAKKPSAKRFAQAVFALGLERNELGKWSRDLQAIVGALESPELRAFLEHERVPLASKLAAIQQLLPEVGPLARNLVGVLAARRQVELLPAILEGYQVLLDEYYGRQRALVVTAVPLEEAQKERIVRLLSGLRNGKEVVLDTRVDPSILGGLVVRVGSRLVDGSTRARLAEMRRTLARETIQRARS